MPAQVIQVGHRFSNGEDDVLWIQSQWEDLIGELLGRHRSDVGIQKLVKPVVMVVMQKVDPEIGSLLTELDSVIDKNRVSGLRGFGVLVTDESSRAVPILQTMAFDEKIHMPLTAATTAIAGSGSHNLHPDAATTIILYRGQKAVETIPLKTGGITEKEVSRIRDRVIRFVRK